MHTLLIAGNDEQKERFLRPLAEGAIRSCFAMTEPDVASQRPDEPARRPRCATAASGSQRAQVVHHRRRRRRVRDRRGEDRHRRGRRPSQLLADPRPDRHARLGGRARPASGWARTRPAATRSSTLTDVRVPAGNLLGAEGEGFVIAQKRLAGGRLAHAMRWIGVAQRALDLSASQRLLERKAFGKELARHQMLQAVHDRRQRDRPLRVAADGAARRVEGRARPAPPPGDRDGQDVRLRGVRPRSSTARCRSTAPPASRWTCRSRGRTRTHAQRGSTTAPARCTG